MVRVIGEMVLLLILIFRAVFMCRAIEMSQEAVLIADLVYVTISEVHYQFVIERSYDIPPIANHVCDAEGDVSAQLQETATGKVV